MGREIRQVPMGWQHPKDGKDYIPMSNQDWKTAVAEWEANGCDYDDTPDLRSYFPTWSPDAVMGFCLYETISDGTPVSPIFATKAEVIAWCVEQRYANWAIEQLEKFDFCFSGMAYSRK